MYALTCWEIGGLGRLVLVGCLSFLLNQHLAIAGDISPQAAVALAETFIVENAYTNAPTSRVKKPLDLEAFDGITDRDKIVADRFNSLKPSAIGVRRYRKDGAPGWSVAFDYTNVQKGSDACRVVTMELDGSYPRIEHVDGRRTYFVGFKTK